MLTLGILLLIAGLVVVLSPSPRLTWIALIGTSLLVVLVWIAVGVWMLALAQLLLMVVLLGALMRWGVKRLQ